MVLTLEEIKRLLKADRWIQTSISYLFFTKKYVYKIYKSINLGFIDLSTLQKRKTVMTNDLKLNKLFAPQVYLGMLPLKDAQGRVQEYATKMIRLPEKNSLSSLLRTKRITRTTIKRMASVLAQAHNKFKPKSEYHKYVRLNIALKNWKTPVNLLRKDALGRFLTKKEFLMLQTPMYKYITTLSKSFNKRIGENRIQRVHGDINADDTFVVNGAPYFIDVIVPVPEWEYSDVARDVSSIAMELDAYDYPELSKQFVKEYAKRKKDASIEEVLLYYAMLWAMVRFWVYCSTYKQGNKKVLPKIKRYKRLLFGYLKEVQ